MTKYSCDLFEIVHCQALSFFHCVHVLTGAECGDSLSSVSSYHQHFFDTNATSDWSVLCLFSSLLLRGVARVGVLGCPWPPLGRPSFEQTTYNIQVAKTPWQYLGRKSHCWKDHFFKICFFVKYFRQRLLLNDDMSGHSQVGTSYMIIIMFRDIFPLFLRNVCVCASVDLDDITRRRRSSYAFKMFVSLTILRWTCKW